MLFKEPVHKQNNKSGKSYAQKCRCKYKKRIVQYHDANSGARAVYDQIVAMLREHNTIPSFMSGGKNDITKELAYKDGMYSITLNDGNGVRSDYSLLSSDSNVSVSKSGNKLTISSTVAIKMCIRDRHNFGYRRGQRCRKNRGRYRRICSAFRSRR